MNIRLSKQDADMLLWAVTLAIAHEDSALDSLMPDGRVLPKFRAIAARTRRKVVALTKLHTRLNLAVQKAEVPHE